eukprot:12907138-Prorocentrum_lima.AAC.1
MEDDVVYCGASLAPQLPADARDLAVSKLARVRPGILKLPDSETPRLPADKLMVASRYDIAGASVGAREIDAISRPADR